MKSISTIRQSREKIENVGALLVSVIDLHAFATTPAPKLSTVVRGWQCNIPKEVRCLTPPHEVKRH